MQKLDNSQLNFVDSEIAKIKNRIAQLQKMIQGQDTPKLKKDFIGQQIKQLKVIIQNLQKMKQQK